MKGTCKKPVVTCYIFWSEYEHSDLGNHSCLGNNELQTQTSSSPQHWPGWRRWLIRILTSFCFFGYLLVNVTRCHSQPQYCRKSGIMENYPNLKKIKIIMNPQTFPFYQVKKINHLMCNLHKVWIFKSSAEEKKKPSYFTMTVLNAQSLWFSKK